MMHTIRHTGGEHDDGDSQKSPPPELDRSVRQRAREKRISVNKAVISLLEEHLGLRGKKQPALNHDLDALAGSWTKTEADAFDKALKAQRRIGPYLWK
jgi:hypothetical protein